jgi:hypothetical protein
MRAELKKLIGESHVPSEGDFSDTLWIAKNYHSGRLELAMKHQREAEKEAKSEDELWTVADDIHYYAAQEVGLVWHFCLWRLQAVLEGIITGRYLNSNGLKKLPGLKAKLDALREAGYKIDAADYDELLEWAKVRNQLSHYPPPSYGFGPLEYDDVEEYHKLCIKICDSIKKQRQSMTDSNQRVHSDAPNGGA